MGSESMQQLRGFLVQHQRVVFDWDVYGSIKACATLSIVPLGPSLRTVYLNAPPSLDIKAVALASPTEQEALALTPATWSLSNALQPLPSREPPIGVNAHQEIKRRTCAALGENSMGELAISVTGGWIRLIEGHQRLAPIDIRVEYDFHTDETFATSGHLWMPCVDDLWARPTWELQFIVPRELHGDRVFVVSSGELVEQVNHPFTSTQVIFSYLQTVPTSVQHIGFALASVAVALSDRIVVFDADDTDVSFVVDMMTFYTSTYGSFPFQDFKIVFLVGLEHPVFLASLALLPAEMGHSPRDVESAITIRQTLSVALARQWLGVSIIPRTTSDTWVVNGLSLYIHALCIKHVLGNNEYRSRLKRDMDRCVRLDQGNQRPLCEPGSETLDLAFVNLKAPLVLHIMDRYILNTGTSLGLARVIPRLFLDALGDELGVGNALSTAHFLRQCRRLTAIDLSTFADQWIFGSGCPQFRVHTHFVRKKFLVELSVTQVAPVNPPQHRTPLFTGSLTVRIHEADGAPFEHVVDVKQKAKTFGLPFNTKYKRMRRSKLAKAANELDDEAPEISEAFSYPQWDDAATRDEWRVAEWSDEQEVEMDSEGGGYEWIRLDPECEWLAWFDFRERPWYWVSQLQGDRDVIAQMQAVQFLAGSQLPVIASELAKVVLVENYFYRVRIDAARALVSFNTPDCRYLGGFLLHKLYDLEWENSTPNYLLRAALVGALGRVDGKRKLLDTVPGSEHVAAIICAVGQNMDREVGEAIDKALTIDRLVPSRGNVVSIAGLLSHVKAVFAGQRVNDVKLFLAYTREGNLDALRRVAVDCLLLCQPVGRNATILRYLLKLARHDESAAFRRYVAIALSESMMVSLACGDLVSGTSEPIVPRIKQRFAGKTDDLSATLCGAYETLDPAVCIPLLRLAETIAINDPEPLPGTIIKLAPIEAPTPRVRLSIAEPAASLKITLNRPGLSATDATAISHMLAKLLRNSLSAPFRRPVDPVRDNAPNYHKIITKPIDLATIQAKLQSRLYSSRAEFASDIQLMVDNCLLYNPAGSPEHKMGQGLQMFFNKHWATTEATLNTTLHEQQAPAAVMLPPPPPKKMEKKRKSAVDDVLGAEVDAIAEAKAVVIPAPVRNVVKLAPIPAPKPAPPPAPPVAPPPVMAPPVPARVRPSKLPPTTLNGDSFRYRRVKLLLAVMMADESSLFFRRAVDPIADGCPTYLEEIEHPMDLGTVAAKTERKQYKKMGDVASDIELIFANCRQFNPPGDITQMAAALEDVYWREWPKTVTPNMNVDEKKAMVALLGKAIKDPIGFYFREPVDPIALGIPTYFDIIPREEARDLSLILKKLRSGQYQTAAQVDGDINMMLENAIIFNREGEVVIAAQSFRRWWESKREAM